MQLTRKGLVVCLVLLLASGAVFLLISGDLRTKGSEDSFGAESTAHQVTTSSEQFGPKRPAPAPGSEGPVRDDWMESERLAIDIDSLVAVQRVFDAPSASEMAHALESLRNDDPDYADFKKDELALFCHPAFMQGQAGNTLGQRELFCDGFDYQHYLPAGSGLPGIGGDDWDHLDNPEREQFIDAWAQAAERESRNPTPRFERETIGRLQSVPESARDELFTELVRNAHLPDQVLFLMLHNIEEGELRGRGVWRLGEDIHQAIYPDADLVNAQTVALQFYICRRFGGCGAAQYWTLLNCSSFYAGKCRPGVGFEDVLHQTTPPADFGLAMRIFSQL